MARYRVSAKLLATGQAVIVKVTADDEFSAIAQAGKEFAANNVLGTQVGGIKARRLEQNSKASVYIGQMPSGKPRGRKPGSNGSSAPVPAASAPVVSTPATAAATTAAAATSTKKNGK